MLLRLDITNFMIIERAELVFGPGFNVITGETGAGKSVVLKALALILGEKAKGDILKQGAKTAAVCGHFSVDPAHPACALLSSLEIPCTPEYKCVSILIRRSLTAKGRLSARVNDVAVTSQTLKELGTLLCENTTQHAEHLLLSPSYVRRSIDAAGKHAAAAKKVYEAHRSATQFLEEFTSLAGELAHGVQNLDYLQFRSGELDSFSPSVEDFTQTKALCKKAEQISEDREKIASVQHIFDAGLEGIGALKAWVAQAPPWIDPNFLAQTGEFLKLADNLSFEACQLQAEADSELGHVDEYQERLAKYQDYFRKLAVSNVEELMASYEDLKKRIEKILGAEKHLEEKLLELEKSCKTLESASSSLSHARQKTASKISRSVNKILSSLALGQSEVSYEFSDVQRNITLPETSTPNFKEKLSACQKILEQNSGDGKDSVRLLLQSHAKAKPQPITAVASGGELSRILLAVKKTLIQNEPPQVMVFDEIDKGISGRTADIVGQNLRQISKKHQLICISHLAQVAAYADQHIQIEKSATRSAPKVHLKLLSQKERVDEIARMLSGDRVTKLSRANAKDLLGKAAKR